LRRRLDPESDAMRSSVRWLAHKLPELFDKAQRQTTEIRELQHALDSQRRWMGALTRDVGWMRRATTRQRAINSEMLQLAGLHERTAERDQYLRARMGRMVDRPFRSSWVRGRAKSASSSCGFRFCRRFARPIPSIPTG
jgi:hypothetical protein